MITQLVDVIFAFAVMILAVVALTYGLVFASVVLDGLNVRHRERAVVREARRTLSRDRVWRAHEEYLRRKRTD